MAGAARVAIAERGRIPRRVRAAGDRRRGSRPRLARRAQARRQARRLSAGRGRRQHHRHADGAGARRSRGELQRAARRRRLRPPPSASSPALEKESLDVLRLTGADIERRTVRRLADMRYIGQGSEVTVALPVADHRGRRAARRSRRPTRRCSPARRRAPPSSSWRCACRSARRCPARGGTLELPRHASAEALKGTRPVFFPDAGKTLPTRVWDRYALAPGVKHRRPRRVRGRRKHLHRRPRRHGAPAGRRLHPGGGRADGAPEQTESSIRSSSSSLWRRLISAVDEAAAAMVRTSFSTLVRESYDFSCVITDATGQSLVQASREHPELHRHAARDGEALPALLPARPARRRATC